MQRFNSVVLHWHDRDSVYLWRIITLIRFALDLNQSLYKRNVTSGFIARPPHFCPELKHNLLNNTVAG